MPARSNFSKWLYIIVVVFFFSTAVGMWFFRQGKKVVMEGFREPGVTYSLHEGKQGERTKVTLKDGTEVLLNGATRLLEPGDNTHALLLDGEAWFRTDHTLRLVTNILTIVTEQGSFRVRCFEKQQGATAYLGTGKVTVTKSYHSSTDNNPEVLETGNMVLANKEIDLMEKETYQPAELTQWLAGELVLKEMAFMNAMHVLEEWYGTEIYVDGDVSGIGNVSGDFKNKSLEEVLKTLQQKMPFTFQMKSDRIKVKIK